MENQFTASPAVNPAAAAHNAVTQRESANMRLTAQTGGVIITPQFTDVQVRDVNINNTYVQAPVQKDETPNTIDNKSKCQDKLKFYLKNTTKDLFQGTENDGSSTPLNKIYTELYITEGGDGEVNSEHEVIELECKRCPSEEKKIDLNNIFKPLSNEENPPQRVLTKGIAGIGKTVAVQKFTHDWAEGTANEPIQFIFPFTFRDLNLIKDKQFSLVKLIGHYFKEVKDLDTSAYENVKVLFIFDGLDESKFPLDFKKNQICRSVTKTTTVDVLLTNLINGKLLHHAFVWITSRPAAASRIPPKFINRVTEVRGFNDEQKEEYFKKKISNRDTAQKILSHLHLKSLRSLYIMCHIPVFCWISATALQSLLTDTHVSELPKTVTEMYTHFLIIQTKMKEQKDYQEDETDKDLIMKLGKLAFEQLQKGNIIFYEDDLRGCKTDLKQAAIYSGVCTQIIRKESGLHVNECYSFVHLSVQEFLAALYVLQTFIDSGENILPRQSSVKVASEEGQIPIILLHKDAVEMALKSNYGQWDLFLRFLLGLSQEKNQRLLQQVFGFKRRCPQNNQGTIKYIHDKIKKLSYTDKSINLFHCLNELGDQSLVEQVQSYKSSGDVSKISPSHWSALAFVLLVSNEDLTVFDLKKFYKSDDVLERLLPVFSASKTAVLSECSLTDRSCNYISRVLSMASSSLEELDLSKNKLQDSGIEILSDSLKSPNCKLRRLSLSECTIAAKGCSSLARGLSSIASQLRELDLSKNKINNDGVLLLKQVFNKWSLETLRLQDCGLTEDGCQHLASALASNPCHMKNLDLSRNSFGGQVAQLADFLRHPDCQLERLWLFNTGMEETCTAALASALAFNLSHLKELDLGGNVLGDVGVQEIAALLKDPNCKLDTLRLASCHCTEIGCTALVSSLKLNPAHLRVLDLARNDIRDHGVENLSDFLVEPLCHLETLNLKCCTLTTACCRPLTLALSCFSTLKELDLSYNELMDIGVKLLSNWLRKPQCRLEILRLSGCTEADCAALVEALRLNPSPHLKVLELRKSPLGEAGQTLLSNLKKDERYKLEIIATE